MSFREEEQECEETETIQTELPTSQQIPLGNILSNFVQSHLGEEHKMVIVARYVPMISIFSILNFVTFANNLHRSCFFSPN